MGMGSLQILLVKMRSYWSRVAYSPVGLVSVEENHMKTETEDWRGTAASPGPPADQQKREEARRASLVHFRSMALKTL